jgi:golgi phosphoprotein 3
MQLQNRLHIYEEILLLALRDKQGTIFYDVHYPQALAAALLAELLLIKKVELELKGKRKFVKLADTTPTGDLLLDECLHKISKSKRLARIENWVMRFANIPRLKHKAAQSLCKKGILKMEAQIVLLLFKHKKYPEIDPRPEKQLIEKLRKAIFSKNKTIEPETVILIAICERTGILKHLFDKKKLREKKKWIKEIISGNLIGNATKDAVEAMQAAIFAAVIIPAVVASSS